jgi:hypothetical protein
MFATAFSQTNKSVRLSMHWVFAAVSGLVVLVILNWLSSLLSVLLGGLFFLLLTAIWMFIFAVGLKSAWQNRFRPSSVAASISAPIVAGGIFFAAGAGIKWCDKWAYFLAHEQRYGEIIRLAKAGYFEPSTTEFQEYNGVSFRLNEGPPLRAAFLLPAFYLDGWAGIIYDPTGSVAYATGSDTDTIKVREATVLFQDRLYMCDPFKGSFYQCTFNDTQYTK